MRGFPVLAFGVAVLGSLATCQNSRATVFTVLNTNDSGEGSLRQTILDANASQGRDEIRFDIPGDGSRQILLLTPLPTITDGLIIDGWSQLGASTNSLAQGFDAAIKVQLIGSRLPSGDGITISAPNCTIRGL